MNRDNKSKINLYCQKKKLAHPNFSLLKKEGDDHKPSFTICCTFEGESENGVGPSRKAAEENAALKIVELFKIDQYLQSIEETSVTYSIESYNAPLKDIWENWENQEYTLTLKQKDVAKNVKYKNFKVKIVQLENEMCSSG
jgi:hypothetical protein